jgi:hypothetical protein
MGCSTIQFECHSCEYLVHEDYAYSKHENELLSSEMHSVAIIYQITIFVHFDGFCGWLPFSAILIE